MSNETVVLGAGGFIGGHLVAYLAAHGHHDLRAVDQKPPDEWYQRTSDVENLQLDLSERAACSRALNGAAEVYNLAADMGGMGFIESNKALCMLSVLINTHLLMAARDQGVDQFFFASSACVYAANKQTDPHVTALKEVDAYPAMPEDGYGWEKLFSERMCRHFRRDLEEPINLGSSELVTINVLVDLVEDIAGIKLERRYDLSAPQGVRGRNSDNTLILERLGWEPSIPFRTGLERTCRWIHDQEAALLAVSS